MPSKRLNAVLPEGESDKNREVQIQSSILIAAELCKNIRPAEEAGVKQENMVAIRDSSHPSMSVGSHCKKGTHAKRTAERNAKMHAAVVATSCTAAARLLEASSAFGF